MTQQAFGFPLFAMSRFEWKPVIYTWRTGGYEIEHDYGSRQSTLLRGIALPESLGLDSANRLPLRPRPLAFLGNALIYAIVLLTLRAMWCEGRERWRMRRGRCAACGYDVAGVERCPECGEGLEQELR